MKLKSKNNSSNQEHALLSPSSAKKWLNCPAALACEFGLPNESGKAAVNGTVMHSIAEHHLNRYKAGNDRKLEADEGCYVQNHGKGGISAFNDDSSGVLITADMIGQVQKYLDYCTPICDAAEVFEVERRVNLTRVLHPGVELNSNPLQTFGTADMVAIMPEGMLIVGDLKTGRHKVAAKENKQMMLYALGLLRVYKRLYDITAVRLVIFQPYAGGADQWDTTPEALEHFGKFASQAALKAIDAFQRGKKGLKPADFRPGNDACQWCRFAESCNVKRKVASVIAPDDLSDAPDSVEMTLEQLKAEWDKLPLIRQHIADIEKAMYAALMRGETVEGLKLVEGRPGNRSWTDADAIEVLHGDVLKKEVLMSPTEAAKVLSAEEMAELEPFITRKPGQPSIATSDDKRPAWTPAADSDLED